MAAPSYVSDLAPITDGSEITYSEPTGATLGTLSGSADTDNFIQGTNCQSKTTGASGAPAFAGIGYLHASPQAIVSPACVYAWMFVGGGGLIDSYANNGLMILVGNTSANYKRFRVLGNDTFPYIGWTCVAIDPSLASDPAAVGSPSGVWQYFGAIWNCKINIGKGNPMALDAMRWGRTITVTLGDLANGYATFEGIKVQNDLVANRWGQFQGISGGYQLQGRLLLGVTGGNAVDFRDSNKSIVTAISLKVAASFNAIEVQNAASKVQWDSVVWTALGTVSPGTFTMTDNADVDITSCSFTGLGAFTLLSNALVNDTVFRGCAQVIAPGCDMRRCQFLVPTVAADAGALLWNANVNPDGKLDSCSFSKGANAHHAIAFGTLAPTTMTLNNMAFSGFNASDGQNDSTLLFPDKGADTTWTVNLVNCSGTISVKKARAGDTVNLVVNPVSFAVHVQDIDTGAAIDGARVWTPITESGHGKPYDVTVTITNSGTTATVTHASHGMATNDWVYISGASLAANNGTFQITKISDNSYSYTMASAPGSNPTGTIKATFVVLNGVTVGGGNISASYSWLSSCPVSGRVRKATPGSQLYRTAPIAGTIDSVKGLSVTVQLIKDT